MISSDSRKQHPVVFQGLSHSSSSNNSQVHLSHCPGSVSSMSCRTSSLSGSRNSSSGAGTLMSCTNMEFVMTACEHMTRQQLHGIWRSSTKSGSAMAPKTHTQCVKRPWKVVRYTGSRCEAEAVGRGVSRKISLGKGTARHVGHCGPGCETNCIAPYVERDRGHRIRADRGTGID